MKTELKEPKYQKAYMVKSWGDKIITGNAFILEYTDDWSKNTKAFFLAEGEPLPKMVDAKQVVFTQEHAKSLLSREIGSRKEYYQKQLTEASEKLAALNK